MGDKGGIGKLNRRNVKRVDYKEGPVTTVPAASNPPSVYDKSAPTEFIPPSHHPEVDKNESAIGQSPGQVGRIEDSYDTEDK